VPNSILEAIQLGLWDFEPSTQEGGSFSSTAAMPGTEAKVEVLAERLRMGLPLWHPADQLEYDMPEKFDESLLKPRRRRARPAVEMFEEI
jgi:hypothetical protein